MVMHTELAARIFLVTVFIILKNEGLNTDSHTM